MAIVFAHVVDWHDAGMLQVGGRFGCHLSEGPFTDSTLARLEQLHEEYSTFEDRATDH